MSSGVPDLVLCGVTPSTVKVNVSLQFSALRGELASTVLETAVQSFVLAGARYGYPTPMVIPNESRMSLIAIDLGSPSQVSFTLEVEQIEPCAFQLLRHMVGKWNRDKLIISRICVIDMQQQGAKPLTIPEVTEENEQLSYPKVSSRIAFEFGKEDSGFSKVRRCLVEMRQPPRAHHVIEVSDWIKPWYEILEAGAFSLPIGLPGETEAFGGTVTQFDEVTVEIVASRFLASECAWNVLLNMLDGYGRASFPLSKIIID